jgi:hypothetical protein
MVACGNGSLVVVKQTCRTLHSCVVCRLPAMVFACRVMCWSAGTHWNAARLLVWLLTEQQSVIQQQVVIG